jgi:hypothetical protein
MAGLTSTMNANLSAMLRGIRQWPRVLVGVSFFVFFLSFSASTIQFNDKVPLDDWRHDLRADAAGYYIYLPGFFHHGFKASGIDQDLALELAGNGFQRDTVADRIITKYPIGTALLQLPFFGVAEMIEGPGRTDGWTRTHHRAIEVGGAFYWTLGLLFLALGLRARHGSTIGVAVLVLVCIAFGTNVFYYAFRAPGYSHIYSFFLVALSYYALVADHGRPMRPAMRWTFLFANAFILLVRPIDLIAVVALYGLLFLDRPALLRDPRLLLSQIGVGLMVAFPQLLYWKFVHGRWVVYSYGDEGFTNWDAPYWAEVLMSPMNGLIPHAPVFILLPFGLFLLWQRDLKQALLIGALFVLVIYSFAAWHAWHFGCAYGMRPMVQYTPFLAILLWVLFDGLRRKYPAILHGLVPLLVLVAFVNYRAMLQYDVCYLWGNGQWMPYGRNIMEAFFGKVVF